MQRLAIWRGVEEWRAEAAMVEVAPEGLRASGTQISDDPRPYRVDYRLECGEGFVTRRLEVESGHERLVLERSEDGQWTANGRSPGELSEALDCDLAFSPLTNAMPILRHRLHREPGEHEFTMAWVDLPDLTVHSSRQRYTHLRPGVVRFESLDSQFAGFTADLELDDDGLVVFYPQLAERAGVRPLRNRE
ncbi:MAG: putative glycolipid-binding domain-containing protein [Solirubrobacterales bacterium]